MKKVKLLIFSPLLLLVALFPLIFSSPEQEPEFAPEPVVQMAEAPTTAAPMPAPVSKLKPVKANLKPSTAAAKAPDKMKGGSATRKEIVAYALTLLGKPYTYGGITPNGFDCSGFTNHVFNSFGVDVSRSSSTQAHDGEGIAKEEAKPGDLVIFTGTNPSDRNPGHVGIVISPPGDTITFVHSSSNGGVKISKVEGTGYYNRFLQIRRVL